MSENVWSAEEGRWPGSPISALILDSDVGLDETPLLPQGRINADGEVELFYALMLNPVHAASADEFHDRIEANPALMARIRRELNKP